MGGFYFVRSPACAAINQIFIVMLKSEFYDRTHVSLSDEEYGAVENIYNRVQMDKDEFCRLWLDNRDNKIINELVSYAMGVEKANAALDKVSKELEEKLAGELAERQKHLLDFGRKVVSYLDDESRLYDFCVEEFGQNFVIKVKLECNIDLDTNEREYLAKML
jgi:hypothetical protein